MEEEWRRVEAAAAAEAWQIAKEKTAVVVRQKVVLEAEAKCKAEAKQ